MNYQKIYDSLINRARSRTLSGYKERHHVIPKCMGGGNNAANLVDLTPEEHFVCHQLLLKIYYCTEWSGKMAYACHAMSSFHAPIHQRNKTKLKQFGWVRRAFAIAVSELKKGKQSITKGRPKPYMVDRNKALKGTSRIFTDEHRANHLAAISKPRSTEVKDKISATKTGIPRNTKECPFCLRHISDGNYSRWHGNNCKNKKQAVE